MEIRSKNSLIILSLLLLLSVSCWLCMSVDLGQHNPRLDLPSFKGGHGSW